MKAPLPLREREGPIAQQWEGEAAWHLAHRPLTRLATLGTLSRKGRGADDRRHRFRPVQHRADRKIAGSLRRQVPEPGVHRNRARKAASRPHTRAGTLAKRFAAKEAFSKAVGTGFKRGVFMKDIGVVNLPSGAPTLWLSGGAKARLDALAPEGHAIDIHLTMTDDHPWAQAFVILTARKLEP